MYLLCRGMYTWSQLWKQRNTYCERVKVNTNIHCFWPVWTSHWHSVSYWQGKSSCSVYYCLVWVATFVSPKVQTYSHYILSYTYPDLLVIHMYRNYIILTIFLMLTLLCWDVLPIQKMLIHIIAGVKLELLYAEECGKTFRFWKSCLSYND